MESSERHRVFARRDRGRLHGVAGRPERHDEFGVLVHSGFASIVERCNGCADFLKLAYDLDLAFSNDTLRRGRNSHHDVRGLKPDGQAVRVLQHHDAISAKSTSAHDPPSGSQRRCRRHVVHTSRPYVRDPSIPVRSPAVAISKVREVRRQSGLCEVSGVEQRPERNHDSAGQLDRGHLGALVGEPFVGFGAEPLAKR